MLSSPINQRKNLTRRQTQTNTLELFTTSIEDFYHSGFEDRETHEIVIAGARYSSDYNSNTPMLWRITVQ